MGWVSRERTGLTPVVGLQVPWGELPLLGWGVGATVPWKSLRVLAHTPKAYPDLLIITRVTESTWPEAPAGTGGREKGQVKGHLGRGCAPRCPVGLVENGWHSVCS